jgi:DNA-binding NarL/FixJ family response regulator
MVKLAIVDDNIRLLKSLKEELLNFKEIDSIISSSSGIKFSEELQAMPQEKHPEVVLMDISMGSPNEGILATRQIKLTNPEIEIIMFTISDEDEMIFDAFRAGAVGYLLKNESPSFIVKTILEIKNGGTQMSPSVARKAINFFKSDKIKLKDTTLNSMLSLREQEILNFVSEGLTYERIAERLFISTHTVKTHMSNIFGKLQVNNKIAALKKING